MKRNKRGKKLSFQPEKRCDKFSGEKSSITRIFLFYGLHNTTRSGIKRKQKDKVQ